MKSTRKEQKKPKNEVEETILLEDDEVEDFTVRDCHLHLLIESSNLYTSKIDSFIKKIKNGTFPRIKAITATDIEREAKDRYKHYHANGLEVSKAIKHILKKFKEEDLEETEKLSKGVDTTDLLDTETSESALQEIKNTKKKDPKKTNGQTLPQKNGKKKKVEADSHFTTSTVMSSMKPDFPIGSPRFFIILVGIHDLNLIIEIISLGISIMSVIKVGSHDPEETLASPSVKKFWKDLGQIIDSKGKNLSLTDVALMELTFDSLNEISLSTEIIKILYHLAESYQHYLDYRSHRKIQILPQVLYPLHMNDMYVYNSFMENIPEDANIIIANILYSLVEQVTEMVENVCNRKETNTFSEKGYTDTVSKMYESLPICQLWNSVKSCESEHDRLYYGYQIDRLLSCISQDIDRTMLKTYLHLSALHNMKTSHLIQTENLSDNKASSEISYFRLWPRRHSEEHENNEDNEVVKGLSPKKCVSLRNTHLLALEKLLLCNDITSLLNTTELQQKKYNYIECLNAKDMCMLLTKAWSKMNSYEYSYFKPTNDLLIMFYNKCDSSNMWSEKWCADIKTPVGFQNFIFYEYSEEIEWLRNYNMKHNILLCYEKGVMTKKPLTQNQLDNMTELKNISEILKFGNINTKKILVKENTESHHTDLSGYGKSKYDTQVNKFGVNFFNTKTNGNCDFIAYDILPMKVHITGKNYNIYLANDIRLKVEQNEWSHEGESQIFTEVTKLNHTLSTYTCPTSEELSSIQITFASGVIMSLFRSASANLVITEQVSETEQKKEKRHGKSQKLKGKKKIGKTKKKDADNNINKNLIPRRDSNGLLLHTDDSKFDINFKLSCPNGLHIETKRKYNMFYIKQVNMKQESKNNTMNYCCFLTNGNIIKFMNDNVEILCSDGSIYTYKDVAGIKDELPQTQNYIEHSGNNTNGKVEESPLWWEKWKTVYFDVLKPGGEHIDSTGTNKTDNLELKVAVDKESREVYMKRKDSFQSFLKTDGTLEVSFPDGSIIFSSYIIDTNDVLCDWTIEEVTELKMEHLLENNNIREDNNNENSMRSEVVRLKPSEGYVLVHLQCKMVRPDYAVVECNNMSNRVSVSLQDKFVVHINNNGKCDVHLDNKSTVVSIDENYINLTSENLIVTKFYWERSGENILCSVCDKDNNSYTVNYDTTVTVNHIETCDLHERQEYFILHKDMTGKTLICEDDAIDYINHVKALRGGSVYEYKVTGNMYCTLYNMFHPHQIVESARISIPQNLTFLDLRKIKAGQHPKWFYSYATNNKKCSETDNKFAELFMDIGEPLIAKRVFHKIDGWPEILNSGIKNYIRHSDSILEHYSDLAEDSKLTNCDLESINELEKILAESKSRENIN